MIFQTQDNFTDKPRQLPVSSGFHLCFLLAPKPEEHRSGDRELCSRVSPKRSGSLGWLRSLGRC